MSWTRKSSGGSRTYQGKHRSEHWYRDNQVYFLTARCQARFAAFDTEEAKATFWKQFNAATEQFGFVPWVTTLVDNHYHTVGYLRKGDDLGPLMHKLHGSVAKLVNDLLEPRYKALGLKPQCLNEKYRLVPFWRDTKSKNYFDGCLRDEKQGRLTYRYVLTQCKRHGICERWQDYPHTRVNIDADRAIRRALELNAFLTGVPYKRYQQGTGA